MHDEPIFFTPPCNQPDRRRTLHKGGSKGASPPPPPPPAPPPQAAKAPDADIVRSKNKKAMSGGMEAGPGTTFLTGPSGVDPNELTLGKNTLLGG